MRDPLGASVPDPKESFYLRHGRAEFVALGIRPRDAEPRRLAEAPRIQPKQVRALARAIAAV
ncbi:MAG: hypothetical protein HZB39_09945 [Planctomycetes bacterium]|nr:hypothetical protein [Planctomycetota bacterium]